MSETVIFPMNPEFRDTCQCMTFTLIWVKQAILVRIEN